MKLKLGSWLEFLKVKEDTDFYQFLKEASDYLPIYIWKTPILQEQIMAGYHKITKWITVLHHMIVFCLKNNGWWCVLEWKLLDAPYKNKFKSSCTFLVATINPTIVSLNPEEDQEVFSKYFWKKNKIMYKYYIFSVKYVSSWKINVYILKYKGLDPQDS